jgi:hypothetical protein
MNPLIIFDSFEYDDLDEDELPSKLIN